LPRLSVRGRENAAAALKNAVGVALYFSLYGVTHSLKERKKERKKERNFAVTLLTDVASL
jgi:hypothetical protein